ncbi:acetylcholine receptor subunit alpha-like [Diorhabda sublineata]|uniref:acetylcholine receptor subunit alpha-like n=1 Tax=Diorhabda sublineata TaxID=1163346 RepID=UPI0024E16306|nr:acetylcholine receptor subunit alpha-like [Diorhabda sublineata]
MIKKLFLLFFFAFVQANIYNNTEIDLKKCKTHYSRSGSVYKDFYSITETPGANDTLLLDFHFTVLAPSDAHILLAPSENVKKTDPAYEIVIGAGGNTFCDIRRKQKSDVKASVRVKGLLNGLDPQSFWLHITKDGDIAVGKEGDELPFISWTDPDPLPLKVISFSTWSGIEAKWYFDCDLKKETEEIEKPLTHLEKLRKDLLYHYDPYVRPVKDVSTLTNVSMALNFKYVTLNEHRSIIEVLGITKLGWQDEKLIWDPEKYGGLENMHIFRKEIWQPDLCLLNAAGDVRDFLEDTLMIATYTGYVEWNPSLKLKAFCDDTDFGTWPNDDHKCSLMIGFMRDFHHMTLDFKKEESSLIYREVSAWSITQADVLASSNLRHQTQLSEPAVFEIILTLQRNSMTLEWMLFTPFLFISLATLSSFWLDPMEKMKISIICAQMVFCTLILLGLAMVIPQNTRKIPFLVHLYSYTLVAVSIAVTEAIIVVNSAKTNHRKPVPHFVCCIITSGIFQTSLCLPTVKMSNKYGDLNDDREKHQMMWLLLGTTIDRLTFLVYFALFVYAIAVERHNM